MPLKNLLNFERSHLVIYGILDLSSSALDFSPNNKLSGKIFCRFWPKERVLDKKLFCKRSKESAKQDLQKWYQKLSHSV